MNKKGHFTATTVVASVVSAAIAYSILEKLRDRQGIRQWTKKTLRIRK